MLNLSNFTSQHLQWMKYYLKPFFYNIIIIILTAEFSI